ncbi:hypothetical protein Z043_107743, partial [Scleropages formosus]
AKRGRKIEHPSCYPAVVRKELRRSTMAQCVQSVQEFIQDSFVPMVAVLCSEDADRVTRKNNLNFSELLRPFCRLTSEGLSRFSLVVAFVSVAFIDIASSLSSWPPPPGIETEGSEAEPSRAGPAAVPPSALHNKRRAEQVVDEAARLRAPSAAGRGLDPRREEERVPDLEPLCVGPVSAFLCICTGHLRDPSNQIQVVKNLKICVSNIVTEPPQQVVTRRLLSEVVSASQPAESSVANVITAGDYDLNISATTPWFETYRETFLQSMPASDHEFLNHCLACMLVATSHENAPVEQFQKLSQEQHRIQHGSECTYPKWFIPNTLKYYVLLHDVGEGEEQRAESIYEDMKQRYGTQGCYLLKINSRTSVQSSNEQIPDPWSQYLHKSNFQNQEMYDESLTGIVNNMSVENSINAPEADGLDLPAKDAPCKTCNDHPLRLDQTSAHMDGIDALRAPVSDGKKVPSASSTHGACLTLNDHDRIRQFIQEFTFRGLLPHIEKNIRQLNDQLVSRKGLSRSLFSATKKWFGGGKVPEKSISELKNTSGLLYPPEAPELQIRKMADLCFLVQHYDLAYSCYHTAKKDFLNDQAMLYAAGALEMAAVSAFLQPGAPRPYPAHYMDTAIQTYRDVCKNMVLAERCALLSAEILKSQAKYSEAATLLIKMTSEDSDLRSALLLEQAAHCFINTRSPMVRKFAFHMILAGHRFSKAGQKRHALRCYCQAMQVYRGKGWSLAEDHINFIIGRQSFTLRQPENAVSAFRHILLNDSKQAASQQGAFLREYLYVYKVRRFCYFYMGEDYSP